MADSKTSLPQLVMRNLGDRSYEKRKQAALEIEHIIKDLTKSEDHGEAVQGVILLLTKDYALSLQANHRKGGLIGLAAVAIALMDGTNKYLDMLLPPILKCFEDQEARVRYYACEALYNVTKVARGNILKFFNEIFDGLCTLHADVDIDVKNGAQLLDRYVHMRAAVLLSYMVELERRCVRMTLIIGLFACPLVGRLIKDVVTESEAFDVDRFIPLLRERIKIKNPFIRQLLVCSAGRGFVAGVCFVVVGCN